MGLLPLQLSEWVGGIVKGGFQVRGKKTDSFSDRLKDTSSSHLQKELEFYVIKLWKHSKLKRFY